MVAAGTDIASKRIPNWLTFGLLAVGLVWQTVAGQGLVYALYGAGAAFALHFVLWQIKLEGAGDAKLMMAVGAFCGWQTMLEATWWRYVLLVPYALVTITVLGRWQNFKAAVMWTYMKATGMDVGERPEPKYMPFGPLIALAVPAALYTDWLDFFAP